MLLLSGLPFTISRFNFDPELCPHLPLEEVTEGTWLPGDPWARPRQLEALHSPHCPWNICSVCCSHSGSPFKDSALRESRDAEITWTMSTTETCKRLCIKSEDSGGQVWRSPPPAAFQDKPPVSTPLFMKTVSYQSRAVCWWSWWSLPVLPIGGQFQILSLGNSQVHKPALALQVSTCALQDLGLPPPHHPLSIPLRRGRPWHLTSFPCSSSGCPG